MCHSFIKFLISNNVLRFWHNSGFRTCFFFNLPIKDVFDNIYFRLLFNSFVKEEIIELYEKVPKKLAISFYCCVRHRSCLKSTFYGILSKHFVYEEFELILSFWGTVRLNGSAHDC